MDRRTLLIALGAGALTRPALAQEEGAIRIGEGNAPGFHARPAGAGPFPIVLVLEDGSGVGDFIADTCRKFAKEGFLAVAPLLFASADVADAQVMQILDAAMAWAGQNGGDPSRVAACGFGRGGRAAWLYDAASDRLKAAVCWYGPIGDVMDIAAKLHAPLLGLYGKSGDIAESALLRLEKRAADAGKTAQMIVYVGAGREFAVPGRRGYDAAAAADGWQRMLAWVRRYGAG